MQRDPVREAAKRAERYWYEDGIWEIGFGLLNLVLGAFYLLVHFESQAWNGPLMIIPLLLQVAIIMGAGWLVRRVVTHLKERITYPRTGYVAYRKATPLGRVKRVVLIGIIAVVVSALVGAVAASDGQKSFVPLVVGTLLAGVMVYLGYRFGLARMYGLAVLLVGLGAGIYYAGLNNEMGSAVFFGGFGVLLLITGGITLLIYLGRTHPAGPDELDASEARHD
jgi:hypothetical protein